MKLQNWADITFCKVSNTLRRFQICTESLSTQFVNLYDKFDWQIGDNLVNGGVNDAFV